METKQLTDLSLMDLEAHVDALLDTLEFLDPAQSTAFQTELQTALATLPAKREAVARMIMSLMEAADVAEKRKDFYRAREKRLRAQAERLSGYVLEVIKSKGKDEKTGRYKALDAQTLRLAPRKCPASTVIEDQAMVPVKYKTAVVKMRGDEWMELAWEQCGKCKGSGKFKEQLTGREMFDTNCPDCGGSGRVPSFLYPALSNVKWPEDGISLSMIKEELEKGGKVPGARLETEKLRLEVQ